jgi:hypothetical protein
MKPRTDPALLRDALADVRAHCAECCGGSRAQAAECKSQKCRLYKWRIKPEEAIDLFRPLKDEFFKYGIVHATTFFVIPCWWDEFVVSLSDLWGKPVHKSWWGQLAAHLGKNGFRRCAESRPSHAPLAKARRVQMWETVSCS